MIRFLIQESTQFVRMSFQKPRIIPWLEEQINSQRYPGLRWTNSEQTQFEIPWKHGLRQDKCEDDVKIFEVNLSPDLHEVGAADVITKYESNKLMKKRYT